jgi:hypothetical protein
MAKRRTQQPDPTSADASREPDAVVEAFRSTLKRLGLKVKSRWGAKIKIAYPSGEQVVNITNLTKQLQQHDSAEWDTLIEQFVQHLAPGRVLDASAVFQRPYTEIKSMLMPCLQSPGPGMWSRELAADLHLGIAVDTPEHIMYVPEAVIAKSGHPAEEWLAQAEQNLIERTPADWYEVVRKRPYELRVTTMEDCYDSARSVVLDRLLPKEAKHGWIVAPLSRDEMAFVPDRYENPDQIIGELAVIVASRVDQVAYPISHRVYTLKQGEWATKPMILGPGNMPIFIEVNPPWLDTTGE